MPSERIASASRSPISASRNGSRPGRGSIRCTSTPSAANMHAYSQPITPPPITAIERGSRWIRRIPSASWTSSSSYGMSAGRYGRRPGGDQDHVGGQARRRAVGRGDLDGVRVDEPSGAAHQVDPVAIDVRVDPLELQVADRVLALEEPRDRHLRIQVDQHAVEVPLPVARQEQGGLAQGLRGQRAGVDGGASGLGLPLDDRDPLAEVRGLGGTALARGATADHHQVVVRAHGRSLEPFGRFAGRPSGNERETRSQALQWPSGLGRKDEV